MGRGRAKAKQTKVARALKYGGPETDFDRLQAELAGGTHATHEVDDAVDDDELEDDPYAKYYDEDEDSDEDEQRAV